MKKLLYFVFLGFIGLNFQSCYKDVGPIEGDGTLEDAVVIENVSFNDDVQPIFNSYCISCHPNSGNLDLTSGNSYDNLVNVYASGYSGILVIPYDPDHSILYKKIDGSGAYGTNMPLGSSLSSTQIAIIKQWIVEGALDN